MRAAQFERLCSRLRFTAEIIDYDKESPEGRSTGLASITKMQA
jgi:hypothetical protein